MTGEEGTKVVSSNSSINSGAVVDLSVTDSTTGVIIRGGDKGSSSINGQSEVDTSSGGSPLTSDLSKTAASSKNNGKSLNSSTITDAVDSGDFEGSSTNKSTLEVLNTPLTPLKRNGRTESGTYSQKDETLAECPIISDEDLTIVPREQLVQTYHDLQQYIQSLKKDNAHLKESEEKLRLQHLESSRRENVLVMRLTTKEQELQEFVAQLNELKSTVAPSSGSLRSTLLDPAVNFIIQRMKKELDETKKKLEDTQNDLNAWKFTPDSNTGKRLMAKCRMLYQENEELGKTISSGRLAKLEAECALHISITHEMKNSQSELDELTQELDEDVEGMQSTIYYLQQQLRESKTMLSNISSSNSLTSNNYNSDEISVNVSELCAHCRANHLEKKQQCNSSPGTSKNCLKMEVAATREEDDSLRIDEDDERTCVNGEADLNRSDNEESDGHMRTMKSKHSRDTNIDDSDSKIFVQKKECEIGSEGERRTKLNLGNQIGSECDKELDLSYTSPPAKRTKLANHSSSASSTKHLNPVQVQNSNDSPILVNNSSGTGFNRNGTVDH